MSVEAHKEPNYMRVFWALLGLTLLEVGIVYLHMAKIYLVTALILMALLKAFLVAWYFMHLRSERWTLIFITTLPLFLVIDLFLGLLPDISKKLF